MKLPNLSNTPVSILSRVLAANANISTNILLKNILCSFLSMLCLFINIHICEYMEKKIIFAFTDSTPLRKDTGVFESFGRFIGLKCHNYALCLRSVYK